MTFLTILAALIYLHLSVGLKRPAGDQHWYVYWVVHGSLCLIGVAGLVDGFMAGAGGQGGNANLSVFAFAGLGLGSIFIFSWHLWVGTKAQNWVGVSGFLRLGFVVWGCMSGLYLFGTTLDHFWFFRGEGHTAIASTQLLEAKDVSCGRILLVRIEARASRYRCPIGAVLGVFSESPFVPWPDYEDGQSDQIKQGIESLLAGQKQGVNYRRGSKPFGGLK